MLATVAFIIWYCKLFASSYMYLGKDVTEEFVEELLPLGLGHGFTQDIFCGHFMFLQGDIISLQENCQLKQELPTIRLRRKPYHLEMYQKCNIKYRSI